MYGKGNSITYNFEMRVIKDENDLEEWHDDS